MVLKEFPNGVTSSQQYNNGEKPTVTQLLYTNINHVGTPKQKHTSYTVFWDLEFQTTVQ